MRRLGSTHSTRASILVAAVLANTTTWGCNANDEADECRTQCGPNTRDCDEQPLESFGDLESGRTIYQERCDDGARWAFEAQCADGIVVLRSGTGFGSEGRFYDPDSGEFLGLTVTGDQSSQPCFNKSYWPVRVACREPVITRVLCGTTFSEGESAGRGVTQ